MYSAALAYAKSGAKWFDGNIKTIPYVGNGYILFCENVGKPGWDLACKTKDAVAPHFNKIKDPVMEKATKHPHITIAVGGVLALSLVRALYKNYINPENP